MGYFAQATTDSLGRSLVNTYGIDFTMLTAQRLGCASEEAKQVSIKYMYEETLGRALIAERFASYNLLINILLNDEKISPTTFAKFYNAGRKKVIIIGDAQYCIEGKKYYGDVSNNKRFQIEEQEDEE